MNYPMTSNIDIGTTLTRSISNVPSLQSRNKLQLRFVKPRLEIFNALEAKSKASLRSNFSSMSAVSEVTVHYEGELRELDKFQGTKKVKEVYSRKAGTL